MARRLREAHATVGWRVDNDAVCCCVSIKYVQQFVWITSRAGSAVTRHIHVECETCTCQKGTRQSRRPRVRGGGEGDEKGAVWLSANDERSLRQLTSRNFTDCNAVNALRGDMHE